MSYGNQRLMRRFPPSPRVPFQAPPPNGVHGNGAAGNGAGGPPGGVPPGAAGAAQAQGAGGSGSVLLPDYSVYAGTPSHVANMRARANAPGFVAESEVKMELLKRQQICLAQVFNFLLRSRPFCVV